MAQHTVTDTAPEAAHADERALLDQIRALEDSKARICAEQATLSLQLDHAVRACHEEARIPARRRGRDVAGLIAYA